MNDSGGDHGRRHGRRLSIKDLGRMIESHYQANGQRSADRMSHAITHMGRYFGTHTGVYAAQHFLDYAHARFVDGAARGTVQRERAALRLGLRLAWERGALRAIPPIARIRVRNARRGFFASREFWRLYEQLREPVNDIALFAYIAGWRRGEILGLQWSSVDLDAGTIRLDPGTTKNGEARVFPFGKHRLFLALVRRRWTLRRGPFMFHRNGLPVISFRKEWNRACERSGVGSRLLHDLRRTAARDMVQAGTPTPTAMSILGLKTMAMLVRYAIQDGRDVERGIERMSEFHDATRREPVIKPE